MIFFINKHSGQKIDNMISLVRDAYNAMRDEFFTWKKILRDGNRTYSEEAIMRMLEEFKKPEIPYEDKIPTLPPEYNNQHWEILYNKVTYKPEKLSSFQCMALEPAFYSYFDDQGITGNSKKPAPVNQEKVDKKSSTIE